MEGTMEYVGGGLLVWEGAIWRVIVGMLWREDGTRLYGFMV